MTKFTKSACAVAALFAMAATAPALAQGCDPSRIKVKELKLQILHSSDNESSFQDPNTLEPKILNYAALASALQTVGVRSGYFPFHVTAGDHTIPNLFYQASAEVPAFGAPGIADIEFYNAMGLAVNGMGNHEFDGGIDDFSRMLARAEYPFIAVNLDFTNAQVGPTAPEIEIGVDRDRATRQTGKVVKSTLLQAFDQCIGVIGRAPADFFNVIKDPARTIPGIDFVGGRDPQTNQPLVSAVEQVLDEVAALEAQGINKIILIDHAQDFTGDPLSAKLLRGIDVIIAAGSTGFMAKPQATGPFNLLRPEDAPGASYPTVREDSEGKTILVVNSDQQFRYIGNLMVTFDRNGNIKAVDGRSGPIATTQEALDSMAAYLDLPAIQAPAAVREIFEELQQTPTIQDAFAFVGDTTYPLNGQRIDVRGRETNLGRVAADSTLWFTQQEYPELSIDVALKNGGGIRDTITGPKIIRLTIGAALAFNNRLAVLEMDGEQLLAAMENSISRVPSADGRFPQIAGMTMEYDASRPGIQGQARISEASRIKTLIVTRPNGTTETLVSNFVATSDLASRTFVMATNDFLSTGGDGYAALAASTKLRTTDIGEQLILEQYIKEALGGVVDVADPTVDPRVVRLD